MKLLIVTLLAMVALILGVSAAFGQTVSPFSGNLDRPTSTWEAETAEDEMTPDGDDDDEEEDPDDDDEEDDDDPVFFDEELEGSEILLCLDASGSMSCGYSAGFPVYNGSGGIVSSPNRWQTVQSEAANAISSMTDEHNFDVIIYDSYISTCYGALTEATGANKQHAISWVYAKNTTGCTNSYDALLLGLTNYGNALDVFMFMSDGMPNTGMGHSPCSWWNCDATVVAMVAGNIGAQTKENFTFLVIQVGGSPMSFMQQLGALPGGQFVLK